MELFEVVMTVFGFLLTVFCGLVGYFLKLLHTDFRAYQSKTTTHDKLIALQSDRYEGLKERVYKLELSHGK